MVDLMLTTEPGKLFDRIKGVVDDDVHDGLSDYVMEQLDRNAMWAVEGGDEDADEAAAQAMKGVAGLE